MIIKFRNESDVSGYGFDLAADRVVRFNKHPDGTYLNTRSTYSINQKTVHAFRTTETRAAVAKSRSTRANTQMAQDRVHDLVWSGCASILRIELHI